jgi:putative hydrolase
LLTAAAAVVADLDMHRLHVDGSRLVLVEPLTALRRIAFLLERRLEPSYRVKAFRSAADIVVREGPEEIARRASDGTLQDLAGIGPVTAKVISEAAGGAVPAYLESLAETAGDLVELDDAGVGLLGQLRGDLHSHSDWSDGGSPIQEMAVAAIELGRDYLALTDHSPRLTVARGLTAERLNEQLDIVSALAGPLGDFRLLSGIEVDILDDGSLDQTPAMLAKLDVVVASVHSKLAMESAAMTRRMTTAAQDPHIDILGHCTGRLLGPKKRGQSSFDAAAVFAVCAERQVAVEINCRPERLDPPQELVQIALDAGCLFSMDTDAHAPGQLDWLPYGVARAVEFGVPAERIVTTWPVEKLLEWTNRKR